MQAARRVADVDVYAPEGRCRAALHVLDGRELARGAHDYEGLRAQGLGFVLDAPRFGLVGATVRGYPETTLGPTVYLLDS